MAEWWEYPKAKYHVNGQNCVVNNLAEELALDLHQWFDHPDKAKEGYKPTLEEKLDHEDFLAENPKPVAVPARLERHRKYDKELNDRK